MRRIAPRMRLAYAASLALAASLYSGPVKAAPGAAAGMDMRNSVVLDEGMSRTLAFDPDPYTITLARVRDDGDVELYVNGMPLIARFDEPATIGGVHVTIAGLMSAASVARGGQPQITRAALIQTEQRLSSPRYPGSEGCNGWYLNLKTQDGDEYAMRVVPAGEPCDDSTPHATYFFARVPRDADTDGKKTILEASPFRSHSTVPKIRNPGPRQGTN